MADLDSHHVEQREYEPEHISTRNARYGLVLFVFYLVLYGAFVLINTFQPELMDRVPAAGVNLAIWYGFGLIAMALVLALIYAWLCRSRGSASSNPGGSR